MCVTQKCFYKTETSWTLKQKIQEKSLDGIDFSAHTACQEDWIRLCFGKTKEINPIKIWTFMCMQANSKRHQVKELTHSTGNSALSPTSCSQ